MNSSRQNNVLFAYRTIIKIFSVILLPQANVNLYINTSLKLEYMSGLELLK